MTQLLIDAYGRRIRKLRISVTDQCNLRCRYCMPLQANFMDKNRYLTPAQYGEIAAELQTYGLEEIRLTGGEPLLRGEFAEILAALKPLKFKKLGLTTNGILLDRYLDCLEANGVTALNISLDTLNSETFQTLAYGRDLAKVLSNIALTRQRRFRIKLNTVMMRGINDGELFDLVEYAGDLDLEIRFLEVMRIGYACQNQSQWFISAAELIQRLESRYRLTPLESPQDATAFRYRLKNGPVVGFIASESQPFCGHCSRWRLGVDGTLRACLLKEDGVNLKHTTPARRRELYQTLLGLKPYRRPPEVPHAMHQIGG
ncbi:MAG: GTP 3',8-cyclase MoaA [Cyanobacteriota bacterium]